MKLVALGEVRIAVNRGGVDSVFDAFSGGGGSQSTPSAHRGGSARSGTLARESPSANTPADHRMANSIRTDSHGGQKLGCFADSSLFSMV